MDERVLDEVTNDLLIDMRSLSMPKAFPLDEVLHAIIRGDLQEIFEKIGEYAKETFFQQAFAQKDAILSVLVVGLIGCIVILLGNLLENAQMTKLTSLVVYLSCVVVTLRLVSFEQDVFTSTGNEIRQLLQVLLPTYCMCVNLSSAQLVGVPTFVLYEGMLYAMNVVIQYVLFPLTNIYIYFVIVSGIRKSDRFAQAKKIIVHFLEKVSNASVYIAIGGFAIREICHANQFKGSKALLIKGVSMLPGVGQMSEQVAELMLETGSILRNIVGVFGILILMIVVLEPAMKLFAISLSLKIIGAGIGILGNGQIASLITELGQVVEYYLRFLLCEIAVLCMSFLVVALCIGV